MKSNDYVDVANVYYSSKENIDSKKLALSSKHGIKTVTRKISTVSDYLRAIIMILSNRYFLKRSDVPIMKYENLFSYLNGENIDNILHGEGIYFRGESKRLIIKFQDYLEKLNMSRMRKR